MSTYNTIPSPSSPFEAEIIAFTANISISVSLLEPEVVDLTAGDSSEFSNVDSTSATMSEPNFGRVMLYTEPEDEASVISESRSPTEVDSDFAMGYPVPDPELGEDDMFEEYDMSDTASVTELTPSEFATAVNCFGPAPPESHSSMQPDSEPCSPTEVDYDFAMGYFGPDADEEEDVYLKAFEYDSGLGYCGPDRKMMRRAQSCLKQHVFVDLTVDQGE